MDGFKKNVKEIIVIGATNLKKTLDPAILRPGRFDKIIEVGLPDLKGRLDLLKHYLTKINHDRINLSVYAKRTVSFSPADIKNLVNIAALNAVKLDKDKTEMEDLDYAFDRMTMKIQKNLIGVDMKQVSVRVIGKVWIGLYDNYLKDGVKSYNE